MGALPSQKYDFVLESFSLYLREQAATFGQMEEDDDYWIKRFLEACDDGEWEL